MKKSVAYLTPFMEQEKKESGGHQARATVLMATVKGDVHDIGKNIVGVVLGCNNFHVIDLGVMVPCEKILTEAREQKVDMIGLSGLITPSLDEMVHVAREMERTEFKLPLLIGGATTSAKHTAVKIAPQYHGCVAHVVDASRSVNVVETLIHPKRSKDFAADNCKLQDQLRASYEKRQSVTLVPYEEALANRFSTNWSEVDVPTPQFSGTRTIAPADLSQIREYIDWSPFFLAWELKGKYPSILDHPDLGSEAKRLFDDAQTMLDKIIDENWLTAKGVYGFWPAASQHDDIIIYADDNRKSEVARFHALRQQWQRRGQTTYLSLADFVAPVEASKQDWIGGFAVTTGIGCDDVVRRFEAEHDDYNSILLKALADRLAEAFAEMLHARVRREWRYGQDEQFSYEELIAERYRGIRPAFGYPAQPDHTEKRTLFDLLDATAETDITLTESFAMYPAASVSGLYFAHPQARYFSVDRITRDQVEDYARRKGVDVAIVERWLSPNLAYEPS